MAVKKKYLSVLGSTGSIGRNTLAIVAQFPDRFAVRSLAAKTNIRRLAQQIEEFAPEIAVVYDEEHAAALKRILPPGQRIEIQHGEAGYCLAAAWHSADTVVSAMVGAAGLKPTLAAIEAQKDVALANKETLVMAGEIVMQRVAENKTRLLPIDSEHSAIFQCLMGNNPKSLQRIYLTASGGPFFQRAAEEFGSITPEEALQHPNWRMGPKISIDSATLMNKGLEIIEAKHLFGVSEDLIEAVIHRQSVIHSMVAFKDGSVMAQLGVPDMKGAIAFALSYPERLALEQPLPEFTSLGALSFDLPDLNKFPCLALAYQACHSGGSLPAVLNAANEVAVQAFLDRRINFLQISEAIRETMAMHSVVPAPTLSEILQADRRAREIAADCIQNLKEHVLTHQQK